jgi:hypothetical protein
MLADIASHRDDKTKNGVPTTRRSDDKDFIRYGLVASRA